MRLAAGIEYSGQAYAGWQRQRDANSVQAAVEAAFSFVANQPVTVVCAGRTDKAVHATGQVIHFDTDVERTDYAWRCGANSRLPRDIAVQWVQAVDDDFHARFSAKSRRYQYHLYCAENRPGVLNNYVTWYMQPLDVNTMIEASQYLLGEHDFTALRATHCQAKTPVRTIHHMNWQQRGSIICLDICANGFLHHMVRNIIGVMLLVGKGERQPSWVQQILQAKDRRAAPATAPSQGLYLVEITYPDKFSIPKPRQSALFNLL